MDNLNKTLVFVAFFIFDSFLFSFFLTLKNKKLRAKNRIKFNKTQSTIKVQQNFSGSNTNGSFTTVVSNSFLSP